jgi:hypothetical protein
MSGSPHQSSTVWKVLHGAPPTPPPARRDPDRHPVNAGTQQKAAAAAAAAGLHSAPASPGASSYLQQQQQQQYQQQQAAAMGLSSSAVSLQLSPSLHGTAAAGALRHQHSSSMDDGAFLHQGYAGAFAGDLQQPHKQAWASLNSPRNHQSAAGSPWGKLPAVATASSPDPDLRSQVRTQQPAAHAALHKHACVSVTKHSQRVTGHSC